MKYDIKPIHIVLKDSTKLDCVIYETCGKGEMPILDINRIEYKLSKDRINKEDFVYFQTEYINGKFHPQNIESYIIFDKGLNKLMQ